MENAIYSCKSTGRTSSATTRLMITVITASKASRGRLSEVMTEVIDSLTGLLRENGITINRTPNDLIAVPLLVYLLGDIPDNFESFLTDALDVMFAGTGTSVFLNTCSSLSEDEADALDKAKVVEVEDFMRVIHDTLGMMAGVEADENDS